MAQSGEEGNGQVRGFASGVADGELHEGGGGVGSERVLGGEKERDHVCRSMRVGKLGSPEPGEERREEDEEEGLYCRCREGLNRHGNPEGDGDAGSVGARGGIADELENGRVGGAGSGEDRL